MAKIGLVTVNYNNASCTTALLDSLDLHGGEDLSEVVVVDNASAPSDLEVIETWLDAQSSLETKFKLVKNVRNTGYFNGLNLGLDHLTENHDKVVICNNDLLFESGFFNRLSDHQWDDDVLVVSPDVVTPDGIHQNPHVQRRFSVFRRISHAIYFSNYWVGVGLLAIKNFLPSRHVQSDPGPCDIYMGVGACYVLTQSFFQKCGRLDDRIFLWGEEALLGNQVRQAGGKTVYCPDLVVKHLNRRTTSSVPRKTQYRAARESYRIYRKYL